MYSARRISHLINTKLQQCNFITFSHLESRFPGTRSIVVACVAMLANALIGCIFMFLYVSSAEIYPTTMRVTALGLCSGLARIGGALAPFVALLVS